VDEQLARLGDRFDPLAGSKGNWIKQLMAARDLVGTMTNEQARMPRQGGSLSFIFLTLWF